MAVRRQYSGCVATWLECALNLKQQLLLLREILDLQAIGTMNVLGTGPVHPGSWATTGNPDPQAIGGWAMQVYASLGKSRQDFGGSAG